MRIYGAVTTAIIAMWGTAEILVNLTRMEVIAMYFLIICAGVFALSVYAFATEPRKKKESRWVKGSNGLDVMIQGRREK